MIRRLAAALLIFGLTAASGTVLALSTRVQDDRTHRIGKKLKCMCGGCNDTAATCFHVGGEFSGPCGTAKAMLKKIDEQVARGDSDDLIVQSFVQEYGQVALIEPPHSGFGQVAWAMPVLYLVGGGILVVLLVSRWRSRAMPPPAMAAGVPGISPQALENARRRVAQETED
jgi:cytochrome c-type biogenesis protein CcmH/NrfF